MNQHFCRWGILGTAFIARKNWQAIRDAGNAVLSVVASRDLRKAREFVQGCQKLAPHPETPRTLEGYEAVLADPEVDAVYVPLPTGVRKEWVIRAANAGKHVLVEKPCGCNVADVREMVAACAANGVQFMDGVMFMHSQRLWRLRHLLEDGRSVGNIRRICAQFTFRGGEDFFQHNIRTNPGTEPLGCLGDLGWYTIRLALWAMKHQMPENVTGRMLRHVNAKAGAAPVPVEFSGELFFRDGVTASFYNSFVTENQQLASISGTKGNVTLSDFVLPFLGTQTRLTVRNTTFVTEGCRFDMNEGATEIVTGEHSNNAANSPEANMFRNFSSLALTGRIDPHWPEIALKTQIVMDACLQSALQGGREISPGC
jgi:predicted dehydrogenase